MDIRDKLDNKLRVYLNLYPDEKKTIKTMIGFLKENPNCFERENLKGHFTGSAWVIDDTHSWILMTHHRQLDLWVQPGGHADGNENLLEVAINETKEETGLTQFKIVSEEIFDLDIHEVPQYKNIPKHFHYDIRFLLEANRNPNDIKISKESFDVAWIHKSAVLQKNNDSSIKRMLNKIRQ